MFVPSRLFVRLRVFYISIFVGFLYVHCTIYTVHRTLFTVHLNLYRNRNLFRKLKLLCKTANVIKEIRTVKTVESIGRIFQTLKYPSELIKFKFPWSDFHNIFYWISHCYRLIIEIIFERWTCLNWILSIVWVNSLECNSRTLSQRNS